jgi:hypothetical protein
VVAPTTFLIAQTHSCYCFWLLPSGFCLLASALLLCAFVVYSFCLLASAFWLLPSGFCALALCLCAFVVYSFCLLASAFWLLRSCFVPLCLCGLFLLASSFWLLPSSFFLQDCRSRSCQMHNAIKR